MNTINHTCHACVALALAGLVLGACGCRKAAPKPEIAVPVIAAEVLVRDQPIFAENIGQTFGAQDVEIRARVAGFLETVNFVEGTPVEKGALLYTIDRAPFEAALDQAKGVLAQAESSWSKSMLDTNRLGPLWNQNAIARQQYDDALAAERAAAANVQAARAAVDTAQIQLDYTEIYAPIEGIVGKTEVKAGNLVGQGQATLLTTLSSVDPIHVRFSISERDYLWWRNQPGEKAEQPGKTPAGIFELILADGTTHPQRGSIAFADRQIDPRTGTLLLEVAFPNPTRVIRPGQFGRVRFPVGVITNAMLVPQRAVQQLQANYSAYVVSPEQKAEHRKVELWTRIGTFFVIRSGIKPGDKVVIEGIQKLQNGVPVAVTLTNLSPKGLPTLDFFK